MTNPNNAVGTNAAYGGRTSVNAFNDLANFYSRGIVSGWVAAPSSGMTIQLGGLAGIRDVALAEDPNGNKTTVNNTTTSPISVEIAAASTTATRHDLIVAYVNSPAQVSATTLDNPSACGIIAVQGSQSSLPNDAAIRAAITSDGGTGTTAYYVPLAEVSVPANTTTITSGLILQTDFNAQISPAGILPPQSITADKIDFATFTATLVNQLFSAATKATTFTGPYSVGGTLTRVGNIVIYSFYGTPTNMPQTGSSSEAISIGYRPARTVNGVARTGGGGTKDGCGIWRVNTNGKIYWYFVAANPYDVNGVSVWQTNDPWPTD